MSNHKSETNPYGPAIVQLAKITSPRCPDELLEIALHHWVDWFQQNSTTGDNTKSTDREVLNLIGDCLSAGNSKKPLVHGNIFRLMVKNGLLTADLLNKGIPDKAWKLPLFHAVGACSNAGQEVIQTLMELGADPNLAQNSYKSAYEYVIKGGQSAYVATMSNYKFIRENNELKANQQALQNRLDQVLGFLEQMNMSGVIGPTMDLPHKKPRTSEAQMFGLQPTVQAQSPVHNIHEEQMQ